MAEISKWVRFEEGQTHTMRLDGHLFMDRQVKSPVTGRINVLSALVFDVGYLDGLQGYWQWSILSEKAKASFAPYLPEKTYKGRIVRVTKTGSGFLTQYTIEWV